MHRTRFEGRLALRSPQDGLDLRRRRSRDLRPRLAIQHGGVSEPAQGPRGTPERRIRHPEGVPPALLVSAYVPARRPRVVHAGAAAGTRDPALRPRAAVLGVPRWLPV